jgi:hypothetical protein
MGAAGEVRVIALVVDFESMPEEGYPCLWKVAFFNSKGPDP